MADLTLTAGLYNSTTNELLQVSSLAATQIGDYEHAGQWNVGTSEESKAIDTDIVDAGLYIFINRDDTNFVDIGYATATYGIRLLPGEAAVGRLPPATATIFAKADTAAVRLQFKVYEA